MTRSKKNEDEVNWRAFPFVRLVVVLSIGIVAADGLTYSQSKWMVIPAGVMVLLTAALGCRYVFSMWMSIGWLGFFLGLVNDARLNPRHYSKYWNGRQWVLGQVVGQVGSNYLVSLTDLIAKDYKKSKKIGGRIFISNRSISDDLELGVGRRVLLEGNYAELPKSNQGNSFDFSNWLRRKGAHYEGIPNRVIIIGRPTIFQREKARLWRRFENYFHSKEVLSLLRALVLGDKILLSQEMKAQYSSAGAMHLLAVSGLHVGMVYLIFSQLLRLIPGRIFRNPTNKFGILTIIVWIYAGMTGGAASVRRAATMFSWMALSKWSRERINIYNAIAGSAFLMLCINSNLLWDVGFQLSYAAVLGIVYFYPILTKWVDFQQVVPRYFWSLLAVGGAAQISTMPFTLYYFNQFPIFFWLSGCFAVPLTGVILLLSILFMLFSVIEPIGKGLAWILTILVEFMNWGIQVISELPWSLIEGIYPNLFQVGSMLVMVFLLAIHLFFRNKITIILGLLGLLLWSLGDGIWVWWQSTQTTYIIPYRYKKNRLEIKKGQQTFIWGYDESEKEYSFRKRRDRYMPKGKTIHIRDKESITVSWTDKGVWINNEVLITHLKQWDWAMLKENRVKYIYFSGYLDGKQAQRFLDDCVCAGIKCIWLRKSPLIEWSKN